VVLGLDKKQPPSTEQKQKTDKKVDKDAKPVEKTTDKF
jgi:hypothetical protein